MPYFAADDGVKIYYEVAGDGLPLALGHEFGGDITSWEPQVNFFARRYRVITYGHRGYPPSDVPDSPDAYSQERLVADLHGLLRHLGAAPAYVGGLSMGGGVSLSFGLAYPEMCRALIVAATGTGSSDRERHLSDWRESIAVMLEQGMPAFTEVYANGPARTQFRRKDPAGWQKFRDGLAAHSAQGSSLTMQGVQMRRPTIYELEAAMRQLDLPALLMVGDEDEPCIEPMLFMKRCIPRSGLAVFPQSGHAINLEEPALFNRTMLDFLTAVESGGWHRQG